MMFLLMAVACLLVGMLVLVWSAVVKETEKVTYDENLKVRRYVKATGLPADLS